MCFSEYVLLHTLYFYKFYFGVETTVIFFCENFVISPKQFTVPVLRLISVMVPSLCAIYGNQTQTPFLLRLYTLRSSLLHMYTTAVSRSSGVLVCLCCDSWQRDVVIGTLRQVDHVTSHWRTLTHSDIRPSSTTQVRRTK